MEQTCSAIVFTSRKGRIGRPMARWVDALQQEGRHRKGGHQQLRDTGGTRPKKLAYSMRGLFLAVDAYEYMLVF